MLNGSKHYGLCAFTFFTDPRKRLIVLIDIITAYDDEYKNNIFYLKLINYNNNTLMFIHEIVYVNKSD